MKNYYSLPISLMTAALMLALIQLFKQNLNAL